MRHFVLFVLLAVVAACSDDGAPPAATSKLFPYPRTVEQLKANDSFHLEWTSDKTGIEYHVAEVTWAELDERPLPEDRYDYYIDVPPDSVWVYVPVKDGQLVERDAGDSIALGLKAFAKSQPNAD